VKAGTGAERQTAKEPVKNVGPNFMKTRSGLFFSELKEIIIFDSMIVKVYQVIFILSIYCKYGYRIKHWPKHQKTPDGIRAFARRFC
jgi:hypothetical protein